MRPSDVREVDEILRGPNVNSYGSVRAKIARGTALTSITGTCVRLGEAHRAVREVAGADHRQHVVGDEPVGDLTLVLDAGRVERAEHQLDRTPCDAGAAASSAASSDSTCARWSPMP